MRKDQVFLRGEELKSDLAKLDEHYTGLPDEVKEKGVISFAPYPPLNGDYLTCDLWDRFLPGWRPNARTPHSQDGYLKVMSALRPMIAAAETARLGVPSLDDADLVVVKRHVPARMGKWRLVSF